MPRRKREETQPEEEKVEIKQEVKLEYDIPIPFNDASTSSSVIDTKFVYLQHLDLSELEEETKAILFKNKIGFKSLLEIDKATLKELDIKVGDRLSLLAFVGKCKKSGNVVPPPPAHEKPADDGFVMELIQAFDSSISQFSLETVFKHLQFSYEFWNLSENDLLAIFGYDEKSTAIKIFNAQQYLVHEEHWSQLRMFVDRKAVESFLTGGDLDPEPQLLDPYRVPEFVSQLVKVTPKRTETVKLHCWILSSFALTTLGEKLLGRQEVVNSLVSSSQSITSADAVGWWSSAINNITYLECNQNLFGCQTVVDGFVAVSKYATTAQAVNWWISAIHNITCSNDVVIRRVFSSSVEFKQAFFSLKQKFEQMREDEDTRDGKKFFRLVEKRLQYDDDDDDEDEEEDDDDDVGIEF